MTKAKTAAEKDFATAEINFNAGADALKAGFDKAIAGYDTVLGYGKDTAEAVIKSATVAGQGRRDPQQRNLRLFQAVDGRLHRRRQGHSRRQIGA